METIKNQILSIISELKLNQDAPAKGSIYILDDGSFVNLRDNGFRTHSAFDEYIINSGIADFEPKLLPITYCNAVRGNDGSNFSGEVVLELPAKALTSTQLDSIEKYIDFLINENKLILTIEANDSLYEINLLETESEDIALAINNYYNIGDKSFKQIELNESKNSLMEDVVEVHEELNPLIWEENKLRTDVKNQLFRIANKFIESSDILTHDKIIDIELVGSNASYNYTEYSDLDMHFVVNMEQISCDPELAQIVCNAEKSAFNKNYDISIKGIDVEIYVEDVNAATASNGIYSLMEDKWIKFPARIPVIKLDNDEGYINALRTWKNLIYKVLTRSTSALEVQECINSLYRIRRNSIMTEGEYGKGNLLFKALRNEGLLDALKDKQYELSSKELSLESMTL